MLMFSNLIDFISAELAIYGPDLIKKFLIAFAFFIVVYILSKRLVKRIKDKIKYQAVWETQDYINKTSQLIGSITFVLCMVFAVLIFLQIIGVDVALLIWGISLWIWFAMETTISNMIAWMMMLTNKEVRIWDFVQILWKFNMLGTIDNITIRYTVISTLDKRRMVIPNSLMIATPVKTLKTEKLVRWDISFTIPRYCDLSWIRKKVKEIVDVYQDVLYKENTNTVVIGFDEKGIKLKTYFFVDPKVSGTWFGIKSDIRVNLQSELKKHWILLPYLHVSLDIDN